MLEIEIKAYCHDLESVKKNVLDLGGTFHHAEKAEDTYFRHPLRDFGKTDEALRLRNTGQKCYLTYKGPKIGNRAKTRLEEEIEIPDITGMQEILTRLGFSEFGKVKKTRQVYLLNNIEVCLDTVEGLGTFVELEKTGEDRERTEDQLFMLAGKLGLSKFEKRSYLELAQSNNS